MGASAQNDQVWFHSPLRHRFVIFIDQMYLQYTFPASSTNTAPTRLIDPRLQAPEDDTDISDIEASTKAKLRGSSLPLKLPVFAN
jgi:hypothetical protein